MRAVLHEPPLCSANSVIKMTKRKGKARKGDEDKKRNPLCTPHAPSSHALWPAFCTVRAHVLLLSALVLSMTKAKKSRLRDTPLAYHTDISLSHIIIIGIDCALL